ncbi:MAG TPA: AraC family transcriptional regulator [Niabella sp.]
MNFNVSVLDIIIFIGVVQGIAAILILYFRKRTAIAKAFCLLLLSFILINLKIQLHTLHIWEIPVFNYFPLAIDLMMQPACYLYISAATNKNFQFKKSHLLLFLPCLLFLTHAVIVYVLTLRADTLTEKTVIAEHWAYNTIKYIEDFLSVIFSFAFCFLCYRLWQHQIKQEPNTDMNKKDGGVRKYWLKSLVLLFFLFSMMLAINITLENIMDFGKHTFIYWTIFYAFLSASLYYLSVISIQYPDVVTEPLPFSAKKPDDEKSAKIVQQLRELFEKEKLYRVPDLTIQDLAKKMNLSVASLSYTINTVLKMNYRDFVNDYKISAVKEMLHNKNYQNLSMLGIATEAGFASEASFYRIFKTKVGMSPKEFRETSM